MSKSSEPNPGCKLNLCCHRYQLWHHQRCLQIKLYVILSPVVHGYVQENGLPGTRKKITKTSYPEVNTPLFNIRWPIPDGAKPADIGQMITTLQKRAHSLETTLRLSSVINDVEPSGSSPSQSLMSTRRFMDSITTEVQKDKISDNNAIVLDFPDRLPL